MAQWSRIRLPRQEMWAWSLGWEDLLEKETATHSSILPWEMPQIEEPGCQSERHKRYGFNSWVGKISWRRKWLPTPAFFPGECYGQRSLAGYHHGIVESDTTEQQTPHFTVEKWLFLWYLSLPVCRLRKKSTSGKAKICFLHDWRLTQWSWKASCSCDVLKALDRS